MASLFERLAYSRLSRGFLFAVAAYFFTVLETRAASICNAGDQVITSSTVVLTQSCTITGSLTVYGGGKLVANYAGQPGATLEVQGDVLVGGDAILQVEGGVFQMQQDYSRHRKMSSYDRSMIVLKNTSVVLNQGVGTKYMEYDAFDKSQMLVEGATLDRTTSWLLASFFGSSQLSASNSLHVPTEAYAKQGSTLSISGATSDLGVWLVFDGQAMGTLDLPAQTDASGQLVAYSWQVGRKSTGLKNVPWQINISNAKVGVGIESFGGSQITVNGKGVPASGEMRLAYHVGPGSQTLTGLTVGLQNRSLNNGQLTLKNLQIGPVGWQIYADINGGVVDIYNSIVNEVGAASGGLARVHNSILQLGGLATLGAAAATIEVYNSQIHSQSIEALRDGVIKIYDSAVYGSAVVSHTNQSLISFTRGAFLTNAAGACPLDLQQIFDQWGVPRCNPYLAPGAAVTLAGGGAATCASTVNCAW